jgi:Na+/H+-translocating membrane pyrophosphatase
MIYLPIVMAIIGLIFMSVKRTWVLKQDPGDGKMKEISDYIYEGLAFLKAEYRLLTFRNCARFCFSRNYIYTWNFNAFIIHRGGFCDQVFFSVSQGIWE